MRFTRKGGHGHALAGAGGAAICAAMLIAAPAAAAATPASTPGAPGPHVTGRAAALAQARSRARATHKKVPVSALTTADSSTVANPNGTFTTTSTTQAFTQVEQGCPFFTYFDSVSSLGVGYNAFSPCAGPMRAYYQVDTTGVTNPSYIIVSSTLVATEVFSADNSCGQGSQTVSVHLSGPIGPATDWNNQPALGSALSSSPVETVGNPAGSMCPGGIVTANFNAMPLINDARNGNLPDITFALVGNESYSLSLERFTDNPVITTVYEIPSNRPAGADDQDESSPGANHQP